MPKLPDARQVMGSTPRPGLFPLRVPHSVLISRGAGLEALGRGISEAGAAFSAAGRRQQAEARRREAEARRARAIQTQTERLQAQLEAQQALNGLYQTGLTSPDYKSAVGTYREGAAAAIEEAAQSITDPRAREDFILRTGIYSEQHAAHIGNEAYKRARSDNYYADIQTLEKLSQQALADRGNFSKYIGSMNEMIARMRRDYNLSPQQADSLGKHYSSKIGYAILHDELQKDPQKINDLLRGYIDSGIPEDDIYTTPRGTADPRFTPPADEGSEEEISPEYEREPGEESSILDEDGSPIRLASLSYPTGMFNSPGGVPNPLNVGEEGVDPQIGGVHSLAEQRTIAFRRELSDPQIQTRLAALVEAEVGKENQNGKLGFIETVLNRALARGYDLDRIMQPGAYWGQDTRIKMSDPAWIARNGRPQDVVDLIGMALRGSNVSNYATGNESGTVHSGGAPVTVDLGPGHERFVREWDDQLWWKRMESYGTSSMPWGGAGNPVRIRSDDMNFLESRGGHRDGQNTPPFSLEMASRLRTACESYEGETGGRCTFGAMSRDPANQAIYYQRYLEGGGLAAPPGHSRHERGLAVDIPSGPFLDWMHRNADRFGLSYRVWYRTGTDPGHTEMSDSQAVEPGRGSQYGYSFVPAESGDHGPLRLASLEMRGITLQASPGQSRAPIDIPREPRRTVAEPARPRRVAQAGERAAPPAQDRLFSEAQRLYPALRNPDILYKRTPRASADMLEAWPPGETGTANRPRPREFPINKYGIEVYSDKTRPIDVAGDVVSHFLVKTDPQLKDTYNRFANSLTAQQQADLRTRYQYDRQHGETRGFDQWKRASGLPALFRGYAFKQWPQGEGGYTPDQTRMLDGMMQYLGHPDSKSGATGSAGYQDAVSRIMGGGATGAPIGQTPVQRTLRQGFDRQEQLERNKREGRPTGPNPVTPPAGASQPVVPHPELQLPKRASPGDPGYHDILSNMNHEDIIKLTNETARALAKSYSVPPNISLRNALPFFDMIAKGTITTEHHELLDKALLAASNGDRDRGINGKEWEEGMRRIRVIASDQTGEVKKDHEAAVEFFKNTTRPILRKDDPATYASDNDPDPTKIPGISRSSSTLTPEEHEDAIVRNAQYEADVERMMAARRDRNLDPRSILDPGTVAKPNPEYVGPRLDGSRSAIDYYREDPRLLKRVQQGFRMGWISTQGFYPPELNRAHLDVLHQTPLQKKPGETPEQWTVRKMQAEAEQQDKTIEDLPAGTHLWGGRGLRRPVPAAPPSIAPEKVIPEVISKGIEAIRKARQPAWSEPVEPSDPYEDPKFEERQSYRPPAGPDRPPPRPDYTGRPIAPPAPPRTQPPQTLLDPQYRPPADQSPPEEEA